MNSFRQMIVLLLYAAILAVGVNLFSPNKIPYVGEYQSLSSGDGPVIPPMAAEGDPPFIAVDVAQMEHQQGKALFVDSRDPAEFECGTIPGSLNLPFEFLPDSNTEQYVDSILGGIDKEYPIIIFCSGEECDLSLHLARNLQAFGYTKLSIFFGGAREWESRNFEMESKADCEK